VFINIHTHSQIYDAKLELVNLNLRSQERSNYYSYGLHPWYIKEESVDDDLHLMKMKVSEARCLAVGECGLDKLCDTDFKLQERIFMEQIAIANTVKKPLIIHCVKAFNEVLNCLNFSDNAVPVVFHGFNNNDNIARLLTEQGYYFSFGKALMGYESNAARAIVCVGRKKFFLETDTSDVSIKYIYKKASELLGVDEEILKQQIVSNFESVFKISLE
jgi:TatD DNase family protein